MKKFAIVAAVAPVMGFCTIPAQAAPFVWGNVYTDLLVNENASQKESQIIGIEGGVSTNTTDVYGFLEHNPDLENEFGKVTIHSKLIGDYGVYGRASMFKEGDFSEDRYILGVGYQGFVGDGYAFKPYVGALRIDIGDGATENQAAAGYAGYKVLNPGVVLSSWADARLDESKVKVSANIGIQKDVDFLAQGAYVGAFYNADYNKKGIEGFSDMVQLRIGMHF